MSDKTLLEATDAQLAEILKAIKDVGVDQYADFIVAKGGMDVISNSVALGFGCLVLLLAVGSFIKSVSDMEGGGWFATSAFLGIISFFWITCSFGGILMAKVQQQAPKGYIAQQLVEAAARRN